MPTWRRTSTGSTSGAVDGLAVELDVAVDRAPGTVSFIRLSERRNVLLPQPLGPMSARTSLRVDVDRDVLDGSLLAVANRQSARAHLHWGALPGGQCRCGDHGREFGVTGQGSRVVYVTFA